jgi:hypothetical protein
MKRLLCAIASTIGLVVTSLVCSSGPAAAAVIEHEHFQDQSSEVIDPFCGDLRVRITNDLEGMLLVKTQGPDGLVYFVETLRGTVVFTNLATGKTFTNDITLLNNKDLEVTDNGDGTLTLIEQTAGVVKNYGPDGEFLFMSAGTFWVEILLDHGGTPTDPEDDEFLSATIVKPFTGRDDTEGRDFCDDIHIFTS